MSGQRMCGYLSTISPTNFLTIFIMITHLGPILFSQLVFTNIVPADAPGLVNHTTGIHNVNDIFFMYFPNEILFDRKLLKAGLPQVNSGNRESSGFIEGVLSVNYPDQYAWRVVYLRLSMMTSSNGNTFRVTGPLCREFTGLRWIPRTKASDAELSCFLWSAPK